MSDVIERLKQKEKILRDLQNKKARQEGQKQQLMQQLQTEFRVSTVGEALVILEELQKEVVANDQELMELDSEMCKIIEAANGQPATGGC